MTSILLFAGIILGFFLPGLLVNRLLGFKNDLGTAYIISTVVLFQIIFWLGIAGIKISMLTVTCLLVLTCVVLYIWCLRRKVTFDKSFSDSIPLSRFEKLMLIPVLLMLMLMLLRSSILTNPGGDQAFRWFFLASRILETGTFSFYPPLTAEDFGLYFFTDSFPPIVSFSYFWLYSLFGKPESFLACVPTTIQFAFIFIFGYRLASHLFGSGKAGVYAMLLIGTSTLLFHSIEIAQETGITALCSLALVYFLVRNEKCTISDCLLAAFAASLGALSREYGGIFVLFGVIVILWRKMPLKTLLLYILFCSILTAPWYVRTFILTGNPFYSNPVGHLFPVNTVHVGIIEGYKETIGLKSYMSWKVVKPLATGLALILGISFFTGVIICILRFKKLGYMLALTLMMLSLWIYSIWIPGGLFHSMRILTPVIVINSVCGSYLLLLVSEKFRKAQSLLLPAMSLLAFVTFIQDIFVPCNPLTFKRKEDFLIAACIIPDPGNINDEILDLVQCMPENSAALSENPLYHAVLAMNSDKSRGVRIIPVWSPEVKFLFDRETSFEECCRRLDKLGIRFVLIGREGNLNMNYLRRFEFFRKYPAVSKPLDERKKLFMLPDITRASAPQ